MTHDYLISKKQFILLCHGISIIHNLLMFCSCYTCHKHHGDVVRTSPLPFIFFPNWDYGSKAPAVPQQEPWIESVPKSFFHASRAQHWIGMHWDWCAPLQDVVVIGQWWLPPRYVKKNSNNNKQPKTTVWCKRLAQRSTGITVRYTFQDSTWCKLNRPLSTKVRGVCVPWVTGFADGLFFAA